MSEREKSRKALFFLRWYKREKDTGFHGKIEKICVKIRYITMLHILWRKYRQSTIQIDKTRKMREICVDFVSKKVYSIQALNERASQTSQRNEKSTDRKKKVLDRMTRLWYSN